MNNERFVLFLDILGFSELVSSNSPEDLKQIYDSEIHQTVNAISFIAPMLFGNPIQCKVTTSPENVLQDVQQDQINFHMMSDSVIAWTNGSDLASLVALCQFTSVYLSMSLTLGLPHRGAISIGEIQVHSFPINGTNQSNVVGSGLVNAHNLEAGQQWMGCVIDEICFDNFPKQLISQMIKTPKGPIINYSTPYKPNTTNQSQTVINWTLFDTTLKDNLSFYEEKFARHNKTVDDKVMPKIENTFKFYQDVHL